MFDDGSQSSRKCLKIMMTVQNVISRSEAQNAG